MNTKKDIIKKWYKALEFSPLYDKEFLCALDKLNEEEFDIDTYNTEETDGGKNFLAFLYMCEKLSLRYKEKGIDEEIFYDTLSDLVRWLDIWSSLKGELYLGELRWLRKHLGMELFKLGRLEFGFGKAEHDILEKGIKKGDNVIEIHIPSDGPLLREECEKSIKRAKEFFKKHFPEYKYTHFTCHSWLLDEGLKDILNEESNIIKFQNMFDIFHREESYEILRYLFKWNTNKENLSSFPDTSNLTKKVRERINEGRKFYEALGVLRL